jgi:hypothetical protein
VPWRWSGGDDAPTDPHTHLSLPNHPPTHLILRTSFNLNTGMAFVAASGARNFLGAGHASYVGCTFSRTLGMVAAYGLGGSICVDAGDLELIATPTAAVAGIAATAMLSLQNFMAGACVRACVGMPVCGARVCASTCTCTFTPPSPPLPSQHTHTRTHTAGVMVIIRSPSIRLAALFWRAGQGLAAYVAAGNLTVIRTRDAGRGLLGYAHTLSGKRQVKYFCQG